MPIGPPQRLTPQFCSPGTQRDPRAPKGRGVSQRKSQRVEDGEQENKRERERKLPWGAPLQPITPAGLLSLWVHTASDCPPPSLSSLPIHTEIPSRFHCFQGCAFTLLSEKCFSEILSFSGFASFLRDRISAVGGILALAHNDHWLLHKYIQQPASTTTAKTKQYMRKCACLSFLFSVRRILSLLNIYLLSSVCLYYVYLD